MLPCCAPSVLRSWMWRRGSGNLEATHLRNVGSGGESSRSVPDRQTRERIKPNVAFGAGRFASKTSRRWFRGKDMLSAI